MSRRRCGHDRPRAAVRSAVPLNRGLLEALTTVPRFLRDFTSHRYHRLRCSPPRSPSDHVRRVVRATRLHCRSTSGYSISRATPWASPTPTPRRDQRSRHCGLMLLGRGPDPSTAPRMGIRPSETAPISTKPPSLSWPTRSTPQCTGPLRATRSCTALLSDVARDVFERRLVSPETLHRKCAPPNVSEEGGPRRLAHLISNNGSQHS